MTAQENLHVVYRVGTSANKIEAQAESILLEQTVEVPRSVAQQPFVRDNILGEIQSIESLGENDYRVTLTQPSLATANNPAQLLNVLFGNTSLQANVLLEDFTLPPSLLNILPGPRFGLPGLRQLVQAPERAMTMTALKPMGLSVEELAHYCRLFAEAGIDIIKDDHGLANHSFCPFQKRVLACLEAIQEAEKKTGHHAIYAPNLIGSPSEILEQAQWAQEVGIQAVMVEPMLVGLPFFAELVQSHLQIPVLGHPCFAGATRIAPELVLGKLFRLFGADASIFPHFGGRFGYSQATCRAIVEQVSTPQLGKKATAPVPAGGLVFEQIQEALAFYGSDVILLIGGSLYQAGDQLLDRTKTFVELTHQLVHS